MENKSAFVAQLGAILKSFSRQPVEKLVYDNDCFGEAVYIYYENGGTKRVNVEGDSCLAIMHDVYKALS